nr:MAG TPA: hypothetical protein [Caudoviricetes sp.]
MPSDKPVRGLSHTRRGENSGKQHRRAHGVDDTCDGHAARRRRPDLHPL